MEEKDVITLYKNGESMNSIAKKYGVYATTIKRILEKHDVALRHDEKKEGRLYVKDGEKLIEWAKAQKRLVTKSELAAIIGRKKLSPSYFIKYPELGKYVETHGQKELDEYRNTLYKWLQKNNIAYKPSDKKTIGVTVDALLLKEYNGIALQLYIKPRCVCKRLFKERMDDKLTRAEQKGIKIRFVSESDFENLDELLVSLDTRKKK